MNYRLKNKKQAINKQKMSKMTVVQCLTSKLNQKKKIDACEIV